MHIVPEIVLTSVHNPWRPSYLSWQERLHWLALAFLQEDAMKKIRASRSSSRVWFNRTHHNAMQSPKKSNTIWENFFYPNHCNIVKRIKLQYLMMIHRCQIFFFCMWTFFFRIEKMISNLKNVFKGKQFFSKVERYLQKKIFFQSFFFKNEFFQNWSHF